MQDTVYRMEDLRNCKLRMGINWLNWLCVFLEQFIKDYGDRRRRFPFLISGYMSALIDKNFVFKMIINTISLTNDFTEIFSFSLFYNSTKVKIKSMFLIVNSDIIYYLLWTCLIGDSICFSLTILWYLEAYSLFLYNPVVISTIKCDSSSIYSYWFEKK